MALLYSRQQEELIYLGDGWTDCFRMEWIMSDTGQQGGSFDRDYGEDLVLIDVRGSRWRCFLEDNKVDHLLFHETHMQRTR